MLPIQGAQVRSLAKKPRSHTTCRVVKRFKGGWRGRKLKRIRKIGKELDVGLGEEGG